MESPVQQARPARAKNRAKMVDDTLARFDSLPNEARTTWRVVCALWGVSSPTAWRYLREGRIPKPDAKVGGSNFWTIGTLRQSLSTSGDAR